jgi:hypothetical protein
MRKILLRQEFLSIEYGKSFWTWDSQNCRGFWYARELPSHPQLLDWLAVDFRTNHWNIKRLVKQIVMSATYKQSTVITKEHLAKDPENILLARALVCASRPSWCVILY